MKRFIPVLLILTVLLGLFSGCSPESAYVPTGNGMSDTAPTHSAGDLQPQQQKLALVYYPEKGLNPYTCTDTTNRALFSLLYQSLFTVSRDYEVQPLLCRGYSRSADMKTYIFYPKQIKFSDGILLTASDVAASLEKARTSPVYSGRFRYVESITLTGDGGVQVNLTIPYENFPILLDIPIVRSGGLDEAFPAGTGPYALEQNGTGRWLRLRLDWWCDAQLPIHAEQIPLLTATSPTGIRDQFERSGVGVVLANPAAESYVDFRCDYELWDCENGSFLYLGCRAKSAVFSSTVVRQMLTHAIDRQTIATGFYRSFALPATLPASPLSPYYQDTLALTYDYAPEKFIQALQAENLQGSSIVLLVNKDDGRRLRVAQAIAEMLRSCDLQVTVKALSGENYTSALNKGQYDLHLGQTKLSPNMDLSAFFSPDGSLNFGGMEDAGIYSLCQDALANSGNYTGLHRAVLQDGMLCPVAFLTHAVYAQRGLPENFTPARDFLFFYSLDTTMEEILITE